MTFEEFRAEADKLAYLYLDRSYDLGDNDLIVELTAAKTEESTAEDDEAVRSEFGETAAKLAKGCRRIVPDESRKWRLTFEGCIASSVINESYWSGDSGTVDKEGRICVTENSDWLDYLRKATFANEIYGGIKHYEIRCLEHIINAAANKAPLVVAL